MQVQASLGTAMESECVALCRELALVGGADGVAERVSIIADGRPLCCTGGTRLRSPTLRVRAQKCTVLRAAACA